MKFSFACGTSSLLLLGLYLAISAQPASGGHIIGQPVPVTDPAQVREILQMYRENIENKIKPYGKITFGNWVKVTQQKVSGVIYRFTNLEIYDTDCKMEDLNDENDECFKKQIAYRNCNVEVYDSNGDGLQEQSKIKVSAPYGCPNAKGWRGAGIYHGPRITATP